MDELHIAQFHVQAFVSTFHIVASAHALMGKRKYHARAFQRFITDTAKRVVLDIIKYFAQHTADDIFTEQFFAS